MVLDHYANGEHKEMNYDKIYQFKPGAYLKLQRIINQDGKGSPQEKEPKIYLGSSSSKYMIEFSEDGTKFAVAARTSRCGNEKLT